TRLSTGCHDLARLNLDSATLPLQTLVLPGICDESEAEDGFTTFNLTAANIDVGPNQTLSYYESETDALLKQNPIADPENYTNRSPYGQQQIIGRLETDGSCTRLFGISIEVLRLPQIEANTALEPHVVC